MKTIYKIIIVILLVSNGIFIWKYNRCKHYLPVQVANTNLDTSFRLPPIIRYRDSLGGNHLVVGSGKVINSIIDKEATKAAMEIQQSISEQGGHLVEVTTIESQTLRDSVNFLLKQVNKLNQTVYFYRDKYLSLTVRTGAPTDTLNVGSFDMTYNDSLNIVQYWKRNRVLGVGVGTKKSYTDISSTDPRTTIMGVKKYTIVQKQPEFGVRIQGTARWSPVSQTVSLGPSVTIDVLKSSLRASYLYNFKNNTWYPSISLDKDIIRF